MGFLRRLSSAVLPSIPTASGSQVPARATETFRDGELPVPQATDNGRPSWELSDDGGSVKSYDISEGSSGSQGSQSDSEEEDSDYSSDEDEVRDRYDLMTSHLWQVADTMGWFRDKAVDGLVSIRYVSEPACGACSHRPLESRREISGHILNLGGIRNA